MDQELKELDKSIKRYKEFKKQNEKELMAYLIPLIHIRTIFKTIK